MATKCTGAELKAFYSDKLYWKELKQGEPVENKLGEYNYTWHDDEYITVNGKFDEYTTVDIDQLKDDDSVVISGGIVFGPVVGPKEPSFEGYFKRWKRNQVVTKLVIEIPNESLEQVKDFLKTIPKAKIL